MGGAGDDTLSVAAAGTTLSVLGGAGNDSVLFSQHQTAIGNTSTANDTGTTLYFGTNSGADTLAFASLANGVLATAAAVTIVYDSSLAASASNVSIGTDASGNSYGTLTFGST